LAIYNFMLKAGYKNSPRDKNCQVKGFPSKSEDFRSRNSASDASLHTCARECIIMVYEKLPSCFRRGRGGKYRRWDSISSIRSFT